MRRSLFSTLILGSAVAFFYRRFRRPRTMVGWMNQLHMARRMKKMRMNMNVLRAVSKVVGRRMMRRFAR